MDPLIREYMPNYMAILNSNEVARRQATSDEGKLMAAYVMVGTDTTIESEGTWNGLAYRKESLILWAWSFQKRLASGTMCY